MTGHRLAAICSIDAAGLRGLSAADETRALHLLGAFRQAVAETVREHEGDVLRFLAESALAEFPSSGAALRAATALHRAYREVTAADDAPGELRIAIHVGELATIEDGGVYGVGVGVADGIREEAEPGETLVTRDAWRQLHGRPGEFAFEALGQRTVDGVGAVPVYRATVRDGEGGEPGGGTAEAASRGPDAAGSPATEAGARDDRPDALGRVRTLVSELRRRKVFRVAVGYAVVGWLLVQIVVATFPTLLLPSWMTRAVIVLTIAGFPIAVLLAWAFEVTPEGSVRRTGEPVGERAPRRPRRGAAGGWWRSRGGALAGLAGLALVGVVLVATDTVTIGDRSGGPTPDGATDGSAPGGGRPAVAVLPFENRSGLEENRYFTEGTTDEIHVRLSRIRGLRVISRTSSRKFRDTSLSMPEIGRALGARYALEGSVQRQDGRVRITAQLVDTRTDEHVWADTYDRTLTDIFSIQDEIARHIADALEVRFAPGDDTGITRQATDELAAYDHYLRGRSRLLRRRPAWNDSAIASFRRALEIDPGFAPAHAGLAHAYVFNGFARGEPAWYDSALATASVSIRLDSTLAEGFGARGLARVYKSEIEAAIEAYREAVQRNPNYAFAVTGLGVANSRLGKFDAALPWFVRATRLEPTEGLPHLHLGNTYLFLGDLDRAEAAYRRALEVEPDYLSARAALTRLSALRGDRPAAVEGLAVLDSLAARRPHLHVESGEIHLLLGQLEEARAHFERAMDLLGPERRPGVQLAHVLDETGEPERVDRLLERRREELESRLGEREDEWDVHRQLARLEAVAGRHERALDELERAYEDGWRHFRWFHPDPLLEDLKGERRYRALIGRIEADLARMSDRIEVVDVEGEDVR